MGILPGSRVIQISPRPQLYLRALIWVAKTVHRANVSLRIDGIRRFSLHTEQPRRVNLNKSSPHQSFFPQDILPPSLDYIYGYTASQACFVHTHLWRVVQRSVVYPRVKVRVDVACACKRQTDIRSAGYMRTISATWKSWSILPTS